MTRFRLARYTCAVLALGISAAFAQQSGAPAVPATHSSTADHSKFDVLKQNFTSGPEVTQACLSCHTEAGQQVRGSTHWNWEYDDPLAELALGKRHVFNNFCGNVASNEARCTSCHVGFGWDDVRHAPPEAANAVDCLACHDRSGQYTKLNNAAGHPPLDPVPEGAMTITGKPAWAVDLSKAAQSVGAPGRENCLSCHAYGGGGDNVKHGDISSALIAPDHSVDVHMAVEGANFTCTTCHVSEAHKVDGSRYNTHATDPHGGRMDPGARRDVATCQSCHSDRPHDTTVTGLRLNTHAETLACQTCHIPEYAKGGVAAKTLWDWSAAGQMRDGKPFTLKDYVQGDGTARPTYSSEKGIATWGENLAPEYAWFDGQMRYSSRADIIDPSAPVQVNKFGGTPGDPAARIWPFRVMQGRQAYDTERLTMLASHTWGPKTDTAFWTHFDWGKAISAAMTYLDEPYSGQFDFVDTEMHWPITHMVAPAAQALGCESCHAPEARMAGITGVYVPGRDWQPATLLGLLILGAALLGVAGHGVVRLFTTSKESHHG